MERGKNYLMMKRYLANRAYLFYRTRRDNKAGNWRFIEKDSICVVLSACYHCCVGGWITALFNLMTRLSLLLFFLSEYMPETHACVQDFWRVPSGLFSIIHFARIKKNVKWLHRWLTSFLCCWRSRNLQTIETRFIEWRNWFKCPTFFSPTNWKWKSSPCPNNR